MLAGRGRVDRPRAGLSDVKGRAEQCEQQRHDLRAAPVIARTVGKRSHLETPTTTTPTTVAPNTTRRDTNTTTTTTTTNTITITTT